MARNKLKTRRATSGPISLFGNKRPVVLDCEEVCGRGKRRLKIGLQVRPEDLAFKSKQISLVLLQLSVRAHFPDGKVIEVAPRRQLSDQKVQLDHEVIRTTQLGLEIGAKITEKAIELAGQLAAIRSRQRKTGSQPIRGLVQISGQCGDMECDAVWRLKFVSPRTWAEWRAYEKHELVDVLEEFRGREDLSARADAPAEGITSVSATFDPDSMFVFYGPNPQGWWSRFFASVWTTRSARKHFRQVFSAHGDKPLVSCELNAPGDGAKQ